VQFCDPFILVCDDEAPIRTSISMVLGLMGYRVETALDGGEALQKIHANPDRFALLLTDHKMQPVDGLTLVRELRASGFRGKILVLSGCLENKDREAYLELSVDEIMFKPFNTSEFRDVVTQLITDEQPAG